MGIEIEESENNDWLVEMYNVRNAAVRQYTEIGEGESSSSYLKHHTYPDQT